MLHSSAQDEFCLQILLNCGKQCNGTKAKLNSQSLAGLQGSAQTVLLLSFLIPSFLETHFSALCLCYRHLQACREHRSLTA